MKTSADTTTPGYTATARALHWIVAVLVIGLVPGGFYMVNGPDGPMKDLVYEMHRSLGAVLIPLMLFRLFYRLRTPPPALPRDVTPIQAAGAHAVHWALYALVIVQPVVGWIATSAYRAPIILFWTVELPPIWPQDRAFSESLFVVHRLLGIAIAALVLVHVAAALYHHFVQRDGLLLRMMRT